MSHRRQQCPGGALDRRIHGYKGYLGRPSDAIKCRNKFIRKNPTLGGRPAGAPRVSAPPRTAGAAGPSVTPVSLSFFYKPLLAISGHTFFFFNCCYLSSYQSHPIFGEWMYNYISYYCLVISNLFFVYGITLTVHDEKCYECMI